MKDLDSVMTVYFVLIVLFLAVVTAVNGGII